MPGERSGESVVAPSELAALELSIGDRVRIGGRVVATRGNEVSVADALWATTVQLSRAVSPVAGTLVVHGEQKQTTRVGAAVVPQRPALSCSVGRRRCNRKQGEQCGENCSFGSE